MRKPIIIEFAGLPGSGKTTVEKLLLENLEHSGIISIGTMELRRKCRHEVSLGTKYLNIMGAIFKNINLIIYTLIFALTVEPINITSIRMIKQLILTLQLLEYKGLKNYQIVILDQGLINNIWSIIISGEKYCSRILLRMVKCFYNKGYLSKVAFIDGEIEIMAGRIVSRSTNDSRLDKMESNTALSMLRKHKTSMDHLINCLPSFTVYKLDASDDVESKVDKLVGWITDLNCNSKNDKEV